VKTASSDEVSGQVSEDSESEMTNAVAEL
jgi:hypothetical protein